MGLLSGFDNATGWTVLQKGGSAVQAAYAAQDSSAGDIAYFKSVASKLTTPAALLGDYRALNFVTTAYGLSGQVGQTALLKKLLTQDPNASSSLAQQLADPAYLRFAKALSNWSPPPFSTPAGVDAAVAGFKEKSFETAIGKDNTALQEARYFSLNAQGITRLSDIMADKPLLDVVTTALGIPSSFGSLNYDQQVAILKPRVDMKQFATKAGVASFITKFLAMDQLRQVQSANASSPLLSLFAGKGGSAGQGNRGINLLA